MLSLGHRTHDVEGKQMLEEPQHVVLHVQGEAVKIYAVYSDREDAANQAERIRLDGGQAIALHRDNIDGYG